MHPSRRAVLQGLAALGGWAVAAPTLAAGGRPDARLVVVVLRGGLDGLAAVPAPGDPHYERARGEAARWAGEGPALDDTFALHEALAPLLPLYRQGELLPVHAVGLPYQQRSHFDAQNVLEGGGAAPWATTSGWLNRASSSTEGTPMAFGRRLPLLLRGEQAATSADPTRPPRDPDDPMVADLEKLYAQDDALGAALSHGLQTARMMARHQRPGASGDVSDTARLIGGLLGSQDGPRLGVLELSGWDTHAQQEPVLRRQLGTVASALPALQAGLGERWGSTVVIAVSEFGRTVAANGTGGTDHGVGGLALLAGGAVAGGRVAGDWPGLAASSLHEGRDLRPTTDLRAVLKGVLHDHLQVSRGDLDRVVFPDSADVAPLQGLIRA